MYILFGSRPIRTWRTDDEFFRTRRNNVESSFLRLPGEVRQMIYRAALAGRVFRIGRERKDHRWHYHQEPKPSERNTDDTYYERKWGGTPDSKSSQPISGALLCTCRSIYYETTLMPYAENSFFATSGAVPFDSWLRSIRPAARRAITDLTTQTSFTQTISLQLKGLKRLRVAAGVFPWDRNVTERSLKAQESVAMKWETFGFRPVLCQHGVPEDDATRSAMRT